jgi:hydrogenase-4 component F
LDLESALMAELLVLFPLAMAALTFAAPSESWRPWLLPLGALGHLILTGYTVAQPAGSIEGFDGWLLLDPLARVFLSFQSSLFFLCSLYAPGYLALRADRPLRVFCANLFVTLAMMSLVSLAHHLGLMWVAMEATTLVSARSIYFNQNPHSLEATWKFLLIGSVGIALALLGSFFLAYAGLKAGVETSLFFDQLVRSAPHLSRPWLHAAFVLLFVGYGTKMGLAPMHTWKPDAYGEAPGLVGTLLAGGVTSCAFLAILRVYQVLSASHEAAFARDILIFMGLLSMAFAAVFLVRQRDFKRMLAYSSVEHMGILVLGVGIGGLGVYAALLHLFNNGFTKGVLFLSAGNIHRAYGSKTTEDVRGALQRVPISGALFLIGFLAITGSPPFGPFVSEFTLVSAAMQGREYLVAGLFLGLLLIAFVGMGGTVLAVVQGTPPEGATEQEYRDSFLTVAPLLLFLALVLLLGLCVPPPLDEMLHEAADFLEGKPL